MMIIIVWTSASGRTADVDGAWHLAAFQRDGRPVDCGSLIKLNKRGVRAYMAPGGAIKRRRVDWQSRIGRIASYSRSRSHAYVIWKGTHYLDRVSVDLIEPCSFAPDVADALVRS
jgi:hypothetical protein